MRVCHGTRTLLVSDADTIPAHVPSIPPALHRFLETKFLFWLEVLSVLGVARNGVEALQTATDWLEVCRIPMIDIFSKLLRPDAGVTNIRTRQRLFSFRNRILRGHQRIFSAYLSFCARGGPKKFDRTKTI